VWAVSSHGKAAASEKTAVFSQFARLADDLPALRWHANIF